VAALASDAQGRLYAGGWLHGPGLGVNGVARWDGTAWSALGTGAGAIGDVRALAVAGDGTVYAGGRFGSVAGSSANHVARWDGTAWHPMDGGVTDATRGGGNPGVNALVLDGDGVLHVGGYFDRVGGTISPQYARWRDGAWEPAGGGINGDVRAVAFDGAGRPVIGGLFGTAGGRAVNYVALRDTAGWQRMEPGLNSAVALTHDGAGGIVASVLMSDGAGSNGLARWDGVGWHAMGQGIPAGASCYALVTDSAGTVYYGGTSGLGGPGRVARWTGTAWESLGAPGVTTTLAFGPDGTLFAGGWFGVAKLTPMGWQNLGGVVAATGQAEVGAVAFGSDGSLYATGTFTSIGGAAADNVARWDGTAWHPLGDGLNGQGRALAVDGFGGVYVGGWFTGAGGAPLRYLARWDGEAWSDVGGGTDGPVLTLRYDSAGALWVGGRFGRAGGTSSPYVARWIDRRTTAAAPEPVAMLALEAVRPNPVRDAATIRYVLPTAVDVRVALYDALGREVAVLADGPHRAGAHTVTLQAAGLAPGVYLVRVTGANETLSRTLTVLR